MNRLAATLFFAFLAPLGALAATDAMAPVKAVMDATVSNWAGGDSEWQDIFDESTIARRFSKDFIAKYRAAAAFPAADEDGISPFDYDVIIGGQDACPIQDLTMTPSPAEGGKTEVVARFRSLTCMGTDAASQAFSTVRFEVINEDGNAVIDDIITTGQDGKDSGLKDTMQAIVKQEQ